MFRVEPMSKYGPKRWEGPAPTAAVLAHFRALCPNLVDLMLPSLDPDCGVSDTDAPMDPSLWHPSPPSEFTR